MKRNLFIAFCISFFLIYACAKTAKTTPAATNTGTSVSPNAPPLPNTVDKTDTLKVMAYNVLNYGDGCQGSIATLNGYLKTIIQYAQPDLFSMEKMNYFDPNSAYPANTGLLIANDVLNSAFAGRYAFAPNTDVSFSSTISILFYNKQKLTYVKTETLVNNITDFDLYKLYYNDPNLPVTKDTTFLYVIVNHTQSGSSSAQRDQQLSQEMQNLRSKFAYLPNVINMGDFNVHSSYENGYQAVVTSADTATVMMDPPFFPDKALVYPANWDNNPRMYESYLTTSTRLSASLPNGCGTSGGANSWYDHIFISPWLAKGTNYMKYIPNSYQTIGNDGNRLGLDINATSPVNTSAPDPVIQALWQFSNKYPVAIKIQVRTNRNAYSITDPTEKN